MRRYPGNHTDSELLTVPRFLKTRPGAPQTHLAYVTPDEEKILQEHKPGTPHKGPHNIPNFGTWDYDPKTDTITGGSTADSGSGSGSQGSGWESNVQNDNVYSNLKDTYVHHNDYYKDPLPEDTPWSSDDKIADYSFSTPDVRSSIMDRMNFRKRTGSEIVSNSENLAWMAYNLTNNPNYLNQPIFTPEGMGIGENDELYNSLLDKYNQAMSTGNVELFFEAVEGLEDITAGNPNTQYFDKVQGTGFDDWYRGPKSAIGNSPGGNGYGYGYGNRGSRGYGSGRGSSQREIDSYNPEFGKWGQSTVQGDFIRSLKNRGGIISIVR